MSSGGFRVSVFEVVNLSYTPPYGEATRRFPQKLLKLLLLLILLILLTCHTPPYSDLADLVIHPPLPLSMKERRHSFSERLLNIESQWSVGFLAIEFVIHVLVLSWLMFLGSGFWVLGSRIFLMLCFWFGVLVSMEWSCLGSGLWWFTFWVLGSWFLDMGS